MQPELNAAAQQRKLAERATLDAVRDALRSELARSGIAACAVPDDVHFCEIRKDVVDGSAALYAEWWDANDRMVGNVVVHAAGEFFAEYDVLVDHPTDRRWFVEAVTAWGRPGTMKAELRLLAAVPA